MASGVQKSKQSAEQMQTTSLCDVGKRMTVNITSLQSSVLFNRHPPACLDLANQAVHL